MAEKSDSKSDPLSMVNSITSLITELARDEKRKR